MAVLLKFVRAAIAQEQKLGSGLAIAHALQDLTLFLFRIEGRVIGNAQSTGTFLHAAASEQQAVNLLNQGADRVLFDRGLSTATGLKGAFSPNIRPDVSAVFNDGSIFLSEVVSKTQSYGQMVAKLDDAIVNQLRPRGFSATSGVTDLAFGRAFTNPLGGTLGFASLNMNSVGAGVTFGSQAIYQGTNFASGGFVLYPNKSNDNMMRSVYSK